MHRRLAVLAAAIVGLGALVPAVPAWSSNSSSVSRQTFLYHYHCTGSPSLSVRIGGGARVTATTPPRIRLFTVRFKVLNLPAGTVTAADLSVLDPTNSGSIANSAFIGGTPPGWTANHPHASRLLHAVFSGAQAVPPVFVSAPLRAKYTDPGSGMTVAFRPGPISFSTSNGPVSCTIDANVPPFASVTA